MTDTPTEHLARSGSKLLVTLIVFLKIFLAKVNFEKSADDKNMKNYPACKELNHDKQVDMGESFQDYS